MSQLGARLRHHAEVQPDARAVHASGRWWTYGELVADATFVAAELAVGEGDVVAIALARGLPAVRAVCAAALAGAVPAVLDPEDPEQVARALARLCPAVVVDAAGHRRGAAPPIARAGLAYIIFTSGSTADSKGVAWSEARAGIDWAHEARPALGPRGIAVPLCTALGFQDLLRTLHDGAATVLLDTPFAVGLVQARELGVVRLRLTPTHVDVLLATDIELPALRRVVVASAPIRPETLTALAARLPGARVGRTYGLTESGAATIVWADKHPGRLHTVGRAIAGRRVTVRDPAGAEVPPQTWGEVVIEMPAWAAGDGYLDAPPELARRFADGRLWTGDRGKLDGRGFLVLGARQAEILKVGGRSVSAPHIEAQLGECAIVGVPDRALGQVPCAIYVGEPPAPTAEGVLRADEVPRWHLPRWAFPRGGSGKLRRGQLAREAAAWVAGFPQVIAPAARALPAYALDARASVVDVGLEPWFGALPAGAAAGRVIALATRRPGALLALAYLQAGTREAPGVRYLVGPRAAPQGPGEVVAEELIDVFAAELLRLVALLPGAPVRAVLARTEHPRALAASGFVARGDGWLRRGEDAAVDAAVDAVGAAVVRLGG